MLSSKKHVPGVPLETSPRRATCSFSDIDGDQSRTSRFAIGLLMTATTLSALAGPGHLAAATADHATPEAEVTRLLEIDTLVPGKEIQEEYARVRREPARYAGPIARHLFVPRTWEEIPKGPTSQAIGLIRLLGREYGAPLAVELFVEATRWEGPASRELDALVARLKLQRGDPLPEEYKRLHNLVAVLNGIRQFAVQELVQLKSNALVEYSILRFERGANYAVQTELITYYNEVGATDALLQAYSMTAESTSVRKGAEYYLNHTKMSESQQAIFQKLKSQKGKKEVPDTR